MNRHLLTVASFVGLRRFAGLIRFAHRNRSSVCWLRLVRGNQSSVGLIRLARMNQCFVGSPGFVDLSHAARTNRCSAGSLLGRPHKKQLQKNLVVRSLVGSAGYPDWTHSSILVVYLGRLDYPQHTDHYHTPRHCRTGHCRTGHSRHSYRSQVPSGCLLLVLSDACIPMNVCAIGCRIGVASAPWSC